MKKENLKFSKGDKVVMHSCHEADFWEYKGKIWTCKSDSYFMNGNSDEVVYLEDYLGCFSCDYLTLVKLNENVNTECLVYSKIDEFSLLVIMDVFGFELESKNIGEYRYVFKNEYGEQLELYINELCLDHLLRAVKQLL